MIAPGFKISATTTKSSACPLCLSILMMNSGMEAGPTAVVGPPGRRKNRSPSPSCRIIDSADDALSVLDGVGRGARGFSARTRSTPSVAVVNARKVDRPRSGMSPPANLDLGGSIATLEARLQSRTAIRVKERQKCLRIEEEKMCHAVPVRYINWVPRLPY